MDKSNKKLTQADQQRVEQYLKSPIHQQQRKSFKPLYFVLLSVGSVISLLLLALMVVKFSGVEL